MHRFPCSYVYKEWDGELEMRLQGINTAAQLGSHHHVEEMGFILGARGGHLGTLSDLYFKKITLPDLNLRGRGQQLQSARTSRPKTGGKRIL